MSLKYEPSSELLLITARIANTSLPCGHLLSVQRIVYFWKSWGKIVARIDFDFRWTDLGVGEKYRDHPQPAALRPSIVGTENRLLLEILEKIRSEN